MMAPATMNYLSLCVRVISQVSTLQQSSVSFPSSGPPCPRTFCGIYRYNNSLRIRCSNSTPSLLRSNCNPWSSMEAC